MGPEHTSNDRKGQGSATWVDNAWMQGALNALRDAFDVDSELKAQMIEFLFESGFWDKEKLDYDSAVTKFNGNLNPGKPTRFTNAEIWALTKQFERYSYLYAMLDDMGFERPRRKSSQARIQDLLEQIVEANQAHERITHRCLSELSKIDTTGRVMRIHASIRDKSAQFSMPREEAEGDFTGMQF